MEDEPSLYILAVRRQDLGACPWNFGARAAGSVAEPKIFLLAPAPWNRKSIFWPRLRISFSVFDLSNRIKIVTI